MNLDETVAAWNTAGRGAGARRAIHPLGNDGSAYESSGRALALKVATKIGFDTPGLIVDFGAGDGRVTIPLEVLFPDRVLAVDASAAMLTRLRARAPHIPTLQSDGTDLADHARPDVIVTLAVLIHHRHDDAARIIAGLARALRPGGLLLVDLSLYETSREARAWNDISTYTLDELTDTATAAGLTFAGGPVSAGAFAWGQPLGAHHGELLELRRPA